MKRGYSNDKSLTDAQRAGMNGSVKHLMQVCYEAYRLENGVGQGKMDMSYSRDHNFIEIYNSEGALQFQNKINNGSSENQIWNEKGQHITTESFHGEKHYSTTSYNYDDKGNMTESLTAYENGRFYKNVNTFNEYNQSLESISYTDDKIREKTVWEYSPFLKTINDHTYYDWAFIRGYDQDGNITHISEHKFDVNGKVLEDKSIYTEKDKQKMGYSHVHKYNDHGDCIQTDRYLHDGTFEQQWTYNYQYDEQGKKIEKPPRTEKEMLDLMENRPKDYNEQLVNDHHDNWIKKITFSGLKPVHIFTREISYFGEPSESLPLFEHPFYNTPEEEVKEEVYRPNELEPEEAKWLSEGVTDPSNFPVARYYALNFHELPCVSSVYNDDRIEAYMLIKLLKKNEMAYILHSSGIFEGAGSYDRVQNCIIGFSGQPGYLLELKNINPSDRSLYEETTLSEEILGFIQDVFFGEILFIKPAESSPNYDRYFEETMTYRWESCAMEPIPDKPFIQIIETSGSSYIMRNYPVNDDFEISDLDINYGYGFADFHEELMDRFRSSTKGLVLFHGDPGTGKTYYIRHLLRTMVSNKKIVIYMPPNMVDHLIEPGFMTFLANSIRNWSAGGNFCILLIEDAEPLLTKRREGVRIQGVTNLLNLTDGLLNDMLNLQIICTFNVDLQKLDSALLRPGRLIARKEFKKLDELDANRLAQRLGIKHRFKVPASLGEIYAMRQNQHTLIHEVSAERDASDRIDDL